MPIKLNNKFNKKNDEEKRLRKLINQNTYVGVSSKPIVDRDRPVLPVLTLSDYTLLLGAIEDGEFSCWIDKISSYGLKSNVLEPELPIVEFLLKAIRMYPNPDALLDRILQKLFAYKKSINKEPRC